MKFDYEYFIQQITPEGFATVEYSSRILGSVTKYMNVPYDDPEKVHRKIIEQFPVDMFYGRYLKWSMKKIPESFKGSFEIDFDDAFYSVIDETSGS